MLLEFLAALGKLAKADREAFIAFVKYLGRTRRKTVAPDQEEASERLGQ